ncbi:NRDE family protein [Haloarcula sp. S1CR25-12]|uniref:NRDE family protein n=1 Tax=Haloarcula saliterrae TaxID=2950534 RepID=A0ABU2F907_9EURY|nr:NRDE family protein [Haloarcula sp. S1CR25-12]MDS0258752.1 NRDE family protein [Haloarcula sp. S1CR25-12]
MCTIALAWQVFEETPIAFAANRDELLDRPSEPPQRRQWGREVVAPADAEAEGTWEGYNEDGLLVAVTNRWVDAELAGERSRGLLVRDCLSHESAEAAARAVEGAVREAEYAGFNLLLADENAAILLEWDGQLAVRNVQPGVHVVINVGADGDYRIPSHRPDAGERQATNADRLRETLQVEAGESVDSWLDRAGETIADHDYGVCVHGDGFGTRSSSLIALGENARYEFADGPPCRTEYRPVEGQI